MTEKLKIRGGNALKGEVSISGAKNAVLKLMAAAILPKGETVIHNVPELTDVNIMLRVIENLGVKNKTRQNRKNSYNRFYGHNQHYCEI